MASKKEKTIALVQVIVLFVISWVIFKYIDYSTQNTGVEAILQIPHLFLSYYVVFVILIFIYLYNQADLAVLAASKPIWPYQVGLVSAAFLPFVFIAFSLNFINWQTWWGALIVTLLIIAAAWLILKLYQKINPDYQVKTSDRIILIFGVVIGMIAVTWMTAFITMLRSFMYAFFVSALVEEVMFRGYMQTRLNKAFAKPYEWMGISFGWGLLVPAILFSLWHLFAQVNPFTGSFSLAWPHALWTLFAGLLLGLIREKADSIVPSWLLHGVLNFL